MDPTTLTPPPGWDLTGDPNNPAYRSPTITLPNAPTGFGRSIGINVATNTGITGVYIRDIAGDELIGTLSSNGKTFDLTPKGRSYLQRAYTTIPAGTFNTNAKAQSWLNANLLPVVNNQRATFLNASYKSYTGNYNSNLSSVPGFAGNAPQSGTSQTQVQPASSTGGGGLFNLNIADLEKNFKFGSVDENLKKTDLQYPKDALYNKTQDYLQIGQYHYKPPKSDQLFSPDGTKKILTSGLQKTSALAEFLGIVKLPMPNSVTDSNNVSWGDDNMNNLSAAATADVVQNLDTYLGATAGGGLVGAILGGNAQQGAALGAQGALLYKLLGSAGSQSAQALLKTAGASKVLSMAGFSVSPESILARGFGVVPNSNLELLFNSPTLREFTFQYRMSPRSEPEAKDINKIIRFFKEGMAAKKQDKRSGNQEYGTAGAASYFLGTPNVFQLQYKTTGGNPIQGVNRIKTCALVGFSMNYTADGTWAAYDDGQPVSVIMNMSFKELEPIYDTDYQEDIFDGRAFTDNQKFGTLNSGDLYKISPNDVGY